MQGIGEVGDLDAKIESIMTLLKDKGGDLFSVANNNGLAMRKMDLCRCRLKFENILEKIYSIIKNLRRLYGPLLFFSRQTPSLEMN